MMYDTMARPPRPGSLLEALFTMIQMRREAAKLMEVRVLVQAVRDGSDDGEATQKAFDEYRRYLMPHVESGDKEESNRVQKALAQEFAMGPMAVRSVEPTHRVRSSLHRTLDQIRKAPKPTLGWRRKRW